jgi:hypothetical protein
MARQISPQAQRGLCVRAHVAQLDVAIMDNVPEELVLVQVWDVHAEYDYNFGAASRFQRVMLRIGNVKVRSTGGAHVDLLGSHILRESNPACGLRLIAYSLQKFSRVRLQLWHRSQ